ncbi:hypothetical protein [Flammeovirga sp. SubArs3]|uniref:hypothetical protein n=1 Tax=Flammeovirga sp. SubArs3 TaxID=2995316 RepID=UPI00248D27BD|nr:hypothetical protein [Flammeovirga sp. SubArs3]
MKTLRLIILTLLVSITSFAQSTQSQQWDNNTCGTLSFFSDSLLLHIPQNAFAIEEGAIKGELDVRVKLYANYFDMLEGGIPMKDDQGIYVSGGMYDIEISYKNQKVKYIKPVEVSYISDGIDKFNGYAFNQTSNSWNKLEQDILDYASEESLNDDWGALSPNLDTTDDDWGSDDMDFDGWSTEYTAVNNWLYKTMNITTNGLYNYDYLVDNEKLVAYQLQVEDKEINKVYVHYQDLNTVVYYDVNDQGSVQEFALIDTDLSNVTIFTFKKKNDTQATMGEVSLEETLKLDKEKVNVLKFKYSTISLDKNTLDQSLSSI